MTIADQASPADATGLRLLVGEMQSIGVYGCVVLLAGLVYLGINADWPAAVQWLVVSGLLWGLVYRLSLVRLSLNRSVPETPLYPTLGWANRITILRGGLIAMAGGFFLLSPDRSVSLWLPATSYMAAAIIDRIDGYIARRSGQVSLMGSELDTVFDAMGLVIAPLLAVWFGKVHMSYLLVGMAYYLFQWGLARRRRLGLPVYALAPNFLRRTLAGFQMGFLAVALWPVIDPVFSIIAGWAFMLPMLAGFIVDWLAVSGRIKSGSASTQAFFKRLEIFSEQICQPLLRASLLVSLVWSFRETDTVLPGLFGDSWFADLQSLGLVLGTTVIVLGLMGRLGCLVLVVLLGAHFPGQPDSLSGYVFIFSCVWIMVLGTGRFSLWQWDDVWVRRHDGG